MGATNVALYSGIKNELSLSAHRTELFITYGCRGGKVPLPTFQPQPHILEELISFNGGPRQ
jgi:hypothetical protein